MEHVFPTTTSVPLNPCLENNILKHTISGLVKNRPGILAQIVGVFKKCDLNIRSIAVSETDLFDTSRLTIVVEGPKDHYVRDRRRGGSGRWFHQRLESFRDSRFGSERPRGVEAGR